ncbi:MAG: metallophosphoesterase family protein [Methanomassiliicoccales archaeon]|nr:MAG: metallophosphoesterase family protein [Methanomassiliicoccales archaeon]
MDIQKFRGIFSNLKFVHLSDLHTSKFGRPEKRLVTLVDREKPDVILITGDLVVNYKNDFWACIQTLKKLTAKYGVFAVFGNADHTFDSAQQFHNFLNALKDIDVTLLNNQNVQLKLNGKRLYLVGVDDPFYHFDNFEEAIKGVPSGAPTILLAHSPDILFPRADALVVNLLDSPYRENHFKEWGWEDSTYFGPEDGDVYFLNDGPHIIRVQSRQEGVSLDTILLNPYEDIDDMLNGNHFERIDHLLTTKETMTRYPDLVIIPASNVDRDNIYGKWKKKYDTSALFNFRLDDLPPRKKWHFQPLINPMNYFEANLSAKKDIKYHVWARLKAYNGSPKSDSVYLQFSDSVDKDGREKYRIGKPAYSKDRMDHVDLILTGHTHGGQMRLPFYGPISTMTSIGKRYTAGLHRFDNSILYISRGIGTSVLPIRLFCPPEITVLSFK